ncbi:MAG: aminotransferase class III-fold pyridoxal phosphate-dependent enzyme [Rhodospirillales bacterium]|nr:aminotransferase class III-fold pyridoxal phosphate-dependent enzyme [Rhodospirillales bacterium]
MKTPSSIAGRFDLHGLMIENANGCYVTDVSDGQCIDFILGNLTQIAGHNGISFQSAILETLERYTNVGDYANIEIPPVANDILEISQKHSLRFTNSGSEAVHLAIRLARATTGRSKIIKFVGHYHGWLNEEIYAFLPATVSTGIPDSLKQEMISVEWNDKTAVEEALSKYAGEVAAIICEPALSHSGFIPPFDDFLSFLRQQSDKNDAVLIFDECVTGFRIALGGAQQYYGVKADIVTYSKAVSGGFPMGVVAGIERVMKCVNNWDVFHASTFDSNPLSLAAAATTIRHLRDTDTIARIEENTNYLRKGIEDLLVERGMPGIVQSGTGIMQMYFTEKDSIRSYKDAQSTDWRQFRKFIKEMQKLKVHFAEGDLWFEDPDRVWIGAIFLSSMHTQDVLDEVLDRMRTALNAL